MNLLPKYTFDEYIFSLSVENWRTCCQLVFPFLSFTCVCVCVCVWIYINTIFHFCLWSTLYIHRWIGSKKEKLYIHIHTHSWLEMVFICNREIRSIFVSNKIFFLILTATISFTYLSLSNIEIESWTKNFFFL